MSTRHNTYTSFTLAFCALLLVAPLGYGQEASSYDCTLVIGYSQVRQWYSTGEVFESVVEDGRWEVKAPGGAGVNIWADPDDDRWNAEIVSPCTTKAPEEPDRVVLGVSGPFGEDVKAWAETIGSAISLIRERFPSVKSLELIPVVGGPEHGTCTFEGQRVRASWQHEYIDQAIALVVNADPSRAIVAGPSPHVRDCSDYRDALGHLTDEAAQRVGREIGLHYASQ